MKRLLPVVDSVKWIRPIGSAIIDRPDKTPSNGLERRPRETKPLRPPFMSVVKQ